MAQPNPVVTEEVICSATNIMGQMRHAGLTLTVVYLRC